MHGLGARVLAWIMGAARQVRHKETLRYSHRSAFSHINQQSAFYPPVWDAWRDARGSALERNC
jgi:hypothetical protein